MASYPHPHYAAPPSHLPDASAEGTNAVAAQYASSLRGAGTSTMASHAHIDAVQLRTLGAKLRAASYTTRGMDFGALFARFDDDGSGALDARELAGHLTKILPGVLTASETRALCHAFDTDGDGMVDRQEFERFCTEGAGASAHAGATPRQRAAAEQAARQQHQPQSYADFAGHGGAPGTPQPAAASSAVKVMPGGPALAPEVVAVLNDQMPALRRLYSQYAGGANAMTLQQLTALVTEFNVHPDLLSTTAVAALFRKCADAEAQAAGSVGAGAAAGQTLSCRSFCGWLALAASELVGSLGDLCATPQSRLELLLAKMDEKGVLFGEGFLSRHGGAVRDLNSRLREVKSEAQWQAAHSAQKVAQQRRFGTPLDEGGAPAAPGASSSAVPPSPRRASGSAYDPTCASGAKSVHGLPPGASSARLTQLQHQMAEEASRDLTFKPNLNVHKHPKDTFEERQRKSEEARRLKMVRMKQDNFEKEIAASAPMPMNDRSRKILEKGKKKTLHGSQARVTHRLHNSGARALRQRKEREEHDSMVDSDTGQLLFQPVINPSSRAMAGSVGSRHGVAQGLGAGESLYRNALNRKMRHETASQVVERNLSATRNAPKMNANSARLIRQRLNREVKHMFALYDQDGEGFLNYARVTELLRELGVLRSELQSAALSREERRVERSLLLRLWSVLVPDGAAGVALLPLLAFVAHVVMGKEAALGSASNNAIEIDAQLCNEFRAEYLTRTKHNPGGGISEPRQTALEKEFTEKCTFKPKICKGSKRIEARRRQLDAAVANGLERAETREERLLARARQAEERAAELRAQKAEEEMAECTFAPVVNQLYGADGRRFGDRGGDESGLPRSEMLYQSFVRKEQQLRDAVAPFEQEGMAREDLVHKDPKLCTRTDQEVKEHCTFKPQICEASRRIEAQKREGRGVVEEPVLLPKGYARDIERLRQAQKKRDHDAAEAARVGKPTLNVEKCRNNGSTILQPFDFQTDSRSVRREQQRHRQHVDASKQEMRGARRQEASKQKAKQNAAAAAEAAARENTAGPEVRGPPLLFVDVNLTPTQTERIAIWEEDDPADIAADFASLHSLGVAPQAQLTELIRQQQSALLKSAHRGPASPQRRAAAPTPMSERQRTAEKLHLNKLEAARTNPHAQPARAERDAMRSRQDSIFKGQGLESQRVAGGGVLGQQETDRKVQADLDTKMAAERQAKAAQDAAYAQQQSEKQWAANQARSRQESFYRAQTSYSAADVVIH